MTSANQFPSLRSLIENDCFITTHPLPARQFASYCKERGIDISVSDLEQLEKLGVFYPLARVRYVKLKIKIQTLPDGSRQELGKLGEDEDWAGEVYEVPAHFSFDKDVASIYLRDELLWEPSSRPFQDWENFYGENRETQIESYYSIFQCHALYLLKMASTMRFNLYWWPPFGERSIDERGQELSRVAETTIAGLRKNKDLLMEAPNICQMIANRYYPETQSDRRTIRVATSFLFADKWDWHDYRRKWDAKLVLSEMGIDKERVKNRWERVAIDANHVDPLADWYELVTFVSIEKKKRLKDKAQLAQTFYSMEKMLRSFYEDITQERLRDPDEISERWKEKV